jgi:uncharacterized membrane protein YccC
MNLKSLPITLNPGAVSISEGLRAGIAVAVTLIIGQLFNLPHFGLAALGALLTCFADPGGPVARRAPAVIAFAIFSGMAYGFFGLMGGQGVWVAVPLAGIMIFCASFARIYGQGGLQVGNLLSVVTVLAIGNPDSTMAHAAAQGANFCAGAAWAVLLTLVIWRVHPYAPARRALADVTLKLSRLSRDLVALASAEESVAAFEAHAAIHRRGVREAIESAREVAFQTYRRRGLATRRAAQTLLRLQSFEQIFAGFIALSDSLESDPASRPSCAPALRRITGWLAAIGPDILNKRPLETGKKQASLARLRASLSSLPETSEQRHLLEAIAENLAVLVTISTPSTEPDAAAGEPARLRDLIIAPIRQNLTWGSAPMRHALRAAIIATPVLAFTTLYGGQFAHWATITLVLCLQPYFSATWVRSAERIAGTALGGLLAAGIGLLAQSRAELAFTMLPLTMFAFTIRAVSYGAFIAALTPMIVLLVEQIAPGADELHIALSRVGYTLLGGGLAVLGNLLLWPGFEGARLEPSIARAIAAHAAYVEAVFSTLAQGGPPPDAARRAAGMASNNLEAALARALLEPHKSRDPIIERGAIVDAALRRMAGRLSVLALDRPPITPETGPLWQGWADWLTLRLAARNAPRPPLPPGPGAETLTRLARQVELISG